jgi:hypothetical protein
MSETPDTTETVQNALVPLLTNFTDEYTREAQKEIALEFACAAIQAHNKALAEMVPEQQPSKHLATEYTHIFCGGFNKARRLLLGEAAKS